MSRAIFDAEREERRKNAVGEPPVRLGKFDEQTMKLMMKRTGFSRQALFNRRGNLSRKGVEALLEKGDRIVEVTETHVVVETVDGARQTIWNLDKDLPFYRRKS